MATKRSLRSSRRANVVPRVQATTASRSPTKAKSTSKSKKSKISTKAKSSPTKRVRLQTPEHTSKDALSESVDETAAVSGHVGATELLDRPVEPHRTNAPLVTPRGSRLVTYNHDTADESPSKTGLPPPTSTAGRILEDACAHLIKVEPRLKPLIDRHRCPVFCPEGLAEECDPFKSLCSGIMAQQVSGAAASSIKRRFIGLFHQQATEYQAANDHVFPTPVQVANSTIPFLRQAGLSERKAEYIKGLAEKFASGELTAAMLINASDEEVLERLIAVRGLGRWSVEMFACFGLKRMDIFSTGDLGVQRGMAAFMGKDISKLKAKGGGKWKYMSEQAAWNLMELYNKSFNSFLLETAKLTSKSITDMLKHSEKFAPYRSVFMWYMWRVEEVNVNVLEQM